MSIRKLLLYGSSFIILISLIPNAVYSFFTQADNGSCGISLATLQSDARPLALGGAYVGLAEGSDSLGWNPAGGYNINQLYLSSNHASGIADISYQALSVMVPLNQAGSRHVISADLQFLSIPSIPIIQDQIKQGDAHPYELVFRTGYSLPLDFFVPLRLGIALSMLYQKVYTQEAFGWGSDLGIFYQNYANHLSCGLSFQNIGPDLNFSDSASPLPFIIRLGGAYRFLPEWLTTLEIDFPRYDQIAAKGGIEYCLYSSHPWQCHLRLGYQTSLLKEASWLTGFSGGLGLSWKNLTLDYALLPEGDLGISHHLSATLRLGKITPEDQKIIELFHRGEDYFQNSKWAEAQRTFQDVLKLNPDYHGAKDFLNLIDRIIKHSLDAETLLLLGIDYLKKNQLSEAITIFQKIITLNPEHNAAKEFLETAWEKKHLLDEAKKERQMVTARHKKSQQSKTLFKDGQRLFRQHNFTAALKKFQILLQLEPNHQLAHDYLSKTTSLLEKQTPQLAEKGLWQDALLNLKQLQKNPLPSQSIQALTKKIIDQAHLKALTLYSQNSLEEAMTIWKLILDLDPQNEVVRKAIEHVQKEFKGNDHP